MPPLELFPEGSKKARIEIIPLIDVIFFLLATFVLFTLSLEKIAALDVVLPKPPLGPTPPSECVSLQTSESGTLYWKEGAEGIAEPLTLAELPLKLAAYKQRSPTPRVLIRGDARARFGLAVRALDEVRAAGISQVSIETLVSRTGS
jgi:biopolymer transport protein ExbD